RARGETSQFVRVMKKAGLIKNVDTPEQSALGVAQSAVIIDVQSSYPQILWRASEIRKQRGKQLRPAIKRRTQKRKTVLRHQLVFRLQARSNDSNLAREPRLIVTRCTNNAMR